jgi:hypothetical protein
LPEYDGKRADNAVLRCVRTSIKNGYIPLTGSRPVLPLAGAGNIVDSACYGCINKIDYKSIE